MNFVPTSQQQLKIASSSNLFGLIFLFPLGRFEVVMELETKVKYQRYYYKLLHLSQVPFAGKIGLMVSCETIRPFKKQSAVQFIEEFLKTNNYDDKYIFSERGRTCNIVNGQFKEKIWMRLLEFPDD